MAGDPRPRSARRLKHERRVLLLALVPAAPALLLAMIWLWNTPLSGATRVSIALVLFGCWLGGAYAVRSEVVRPLQSLSNMVAALREGDYSMRASSASPEDALGLALLETSLLSAQLRSWRLGELEAAALLRTVMAEIDLGVFAFDEESRLRLVNRAGEKLLGLPAPRLIGQSAESLGLDRPLEGEAPRVEDLAFPGAQAGRWGIRRSTFRQDGRPHTLLVLTDLSRTLREEQLAAWRRLVRVLSHEINNSLAPIQSIAHTLRSLMGRDPAPADLSTDVIRGLTVIAGRSEGLSRFMSSYARLAQLPPPKVAQMDVGAWVRRAVAMETRVPVTVTDGTPVTIMGDADQLDQLLINLVRNATDASLETGGGVTIGWTTSDGQVEVAVEDAGPGVGATANLFVPFYTTKPNGSGIGLALSRQIAEAHGGTVTLANREHTTGCVATVRLPMGVASFSA
ncbi:MAG TPA: ATP-binding protein [Gemmatimonadaceae bacterium]|nr:ATP-binding protein [Gemmatimonadaceae bacterium]